MKKNKLSLCLTDDIDSLFSSIMLKNMFNTPIEWFYRFDSIGNIENTKTKDYIGVDMDISKNLMCFGNHVTSLSELDTYNPNCANINNVNNISQRNYYSKYGGSTLLMIMSFYDIDIEAMTDEQRLIISCIDGFYIPFMVRYRNFKTQQQDYLKQLEQEHLGEFINFYINKSGGYDEFYKITERFKLNSKINIDHGKLYTDIDLHRLSEVFNLPFVLPKDKFFKYKDFENKGVSLAGKNIATKDDISENIFSLAITGKNYVKYSKSIITNN